jgi:chromosomal replication initiator protein
MPKTSDSVWKNCLKIIKDNVSTQSFKTWFEPIKPIRLDGNVLTIEVPSEFFYEFLEQHYITLLKKTLRQELGTGSKLEYSILMEHQVNNSKPYSVKVPSKNSGNLKNPSVNVPVNVGGSGIKNPFIIPGLQKVSIDSQLNPAYSFDNFVEGDCNRLARSAGFAVANRPGGTSFNPLLIYSPTGLGKTHLIHAIGIDIKNRYPNKTVLYVTSEKFTQQFVDSVKNNSQNDFVNFYQMIDVLIIDDIHFFTGKEKTQDVFFHIFNHLHQTNKQLILTSDKPPIDLQGMEQRLLSRFKWGLSADLGVPDLETRIAILNKKIYTDGIELSSEIIEYIAYSVTSNIREMEGVLVSILAQATLNKKSITLELAKQMIHKFVKSIDYEVTVEYIQKVVCDYFKLPVEAIKSSSRKRDVVQARQIAMYFAKSLTKYSLASIGAQCGGKDHATVLHSCRTVNNLMDTDKKFRSNVYELERMITLFES